MTAAPTRADVEPASTTPAMPVRIIEEVPGVPAHEQFYISGAPQLADKALHTYEGFPCFATYGEAAAFLEDNGVTEFTFHGFTP